MNKTLPAHRRVQAIARHLRTTALDSTSPPSNTTAAATAVTDPSHTTPSLTATTTLLEQVDTLEVQSHHQEIVALLTPLLATTTTTATTTTGEYSWRLARAHERLWQASMVNKHTTKAATHFQQGLTHSQQAVEQSPTSGQAHKWRAIYLAMQADSGGMLSSAKNASAIDTHLRTALITLTEDATLHYMMGRTTFSCAGATWSERAAVKLIGYTVPKATFVEAVGHFRRAQKSTSNVTNCLWLGKSYLKSEKNPVKSKELGTKWLTRASRMKCVTDEDTMAQKEALRELKNLR